MVQRLGVHKRWSKKFLLRELALRVVPQESRRAEMEAHWASLEESLRDYQHRREQPPRRFPGVDSNLFGLRMLRVAEYTWLKDGVACRPRLALGQAFCLRFSQYFLARNLLFNAQQRPINTYGRLETTILNIAAAFSLGWNHAAESLAIAALKQVPWGVFSPINPNRNPKAEHSRDCFARFTLALCADHLGLPLPAMAPDHFPSPAYDALLACWREPRVEHIVEPLLAACDWHTHECMYSRSDRDSKKVDFIADEYMGWPIDILMVYRLREAHGLPLPAALDHPLMQTPFAAYLPPWPVPRDELLEGVTARAIEEVPLLAEMI
jgi:hypothetical protein